MGGISLNSGHLYFFCLSTRSYFWPKQSVNHTVNLVWHNSLGISNLSEMIGAVYVFLVEAVKGLMSNNGEILILTSFHIYNSMCIIKSKCSCACLVCRELITPKPDLSDCLLWLCNVCILTIIWLWVSLEVLQKNGYDLQLHRCRKQIWSLEAHAVPCEALLKERKVISLRVAGGEFFLNVHAPLDCKTKPFSTVYNILASFSDLSICTIFNLCGKQIILISSSFPGDLPAIAFVAYSSLFGNLH